MDFDIYCQSLIKCTTDWILISDKKEKQFSCLKSRTEARRWQDVEPEN